MYLSATQMSDVLRQVRVASEHDWVNLHDIEGILVETLGDESFEDQQMPHLVLDVVRRMVESRTYKPILMDSHSPGGICYIDETGSETLQRLKQSIQDLGFRDSCWIGLFKRLDG